MSAQTRAMSTDPYTGGPEPGTDLVDRFGTIDPPTPEIVRAAQRTIAGHHSTDAAETSLFLNMLGIAERVPEGDTP